MVSVILSALSIFVIGFLWYGPLFGKEWVKLIENIPQPEMGSKSFKKLMTRNMIISLAMALITASVVRFLDNQLLVFTFGEFLRTIIIVWFGFGFPLLLNAMLWEKKSWKLVIFNLASNLLTITVVSAIIYYW